MNQQELFPISSHVIVESQGWEGKVIGYTEDGFALIDLGDFGIRFFRDSGQLVKLADTLALEANE